MIYSAAEDIVCSPNRLYLPTNSTILSQSRVDFRDDLLTKGRFRLKRHF